MNRASKIQVMGVSIQITSNLMFRYISKELKGVYNICYTNVYIHKSSSIKLLTFGSQFAAETLFMCLRTKPNFDEVMKKFFKKNLKLEIRKLKLDLQ